MIPAMEMEFEIEYSPNSKINHWWASTKIDERGNIAIGNGASVWEAIGDCLLDIPRSLQTLELFKEIVRDLKSKEH